MNKKEGSKDKKGEKKRGKYFTPLKNLFSRNKPAENLDVKKEDKKRKAKKVVKVKKVVKKKSVSKKQIKLIKFEKKRAVNETTKAIKTSVKKIAKNADQKIIKTTIKARTKKVKKAVKKITKKAFKKSIKKKKISLDGAKKIVPQKKEERVEKKLTTTHLDLKRYESNPIIHPAPHNEWESKAAFNAAAIYIDNKVHLLYRAVGNDDVSVLGYASSKDGFVIDERLNIPAYSTRRDKIVEKSASPVAYSSGGGWNGGCEDPRLTLIEDTIYLVYTAFDGWGSLGIGFSYINKKDFINKKWTWREPLMISPPEEMHKNWVIFPEKIKGKFAILHSITPEIQIEYFKDLKNIHKEKYIKSSVFKNIGRKKEWDSWVRGAAAPPIKTKAGWLLLYHAMDHNDPDRYKLGAMLLDLKNPSKILYRSKKPILEPDECYENEGFKAGVVYCCGAIVMDDQLLVYYGGADTVVCVSSTNLNNFLKELISSGVPKLKKQIKEKVKKITSRKK